MAKLLGNTFARRTVKAVEAYESSARSGYSGETRRPSRRGEWFLIRVTQPEDAENPIGVYKCEARATEFGNFAPENLSAGAMAGQVVITDAVFVNMWPPDTDGLKDNAAGEFDALLCGYTNEETPRPVFRAYIIPTEGCGAEEE